MGIDASFMVNVGSVAGHGMNFPSLSEDVLEQAADWYDRLEELNDAEQREYTEWLVASVDHSMAMAWLQAHLGSHSPALFDAMQAVDSRSAAPAPVVPLPVQSASASLVEAGSRSTDTASSMDPLADDSGVGSDAEPSSSSLSADSAWAPSRWSFGWTTAGKSMSVGAALCSMAVVALLVVWPMPSWERSTTENQVLTYQTGVAERRVERLSDGSEINLNAQTDVLIELAAQRHVELRQGEAFFSVSQDTQRPFLVSAGDVQIRVVGTGFNVDRTARRVDVRVAHGTVNVMAGGARWTLHAGQGVEVIQGVGVEYEASTASGWQRGWREAKDEPLAAVVAHLQRYSTRPILMEDVDSHVSFSGRYHQEDVEGTLRLIATLFHLALDVTDQRIVLSRLAPSPNPQGAG